MKTYQICQIVGQASYDVYFMDTCEASSPEEAKAIFEKRIISKDLENEKYHRYEECELSNDSRDAFFSADFDGIEDGNIEEVEE